jgi:hypothetical protein
MCTVPCGQGHALFQHAARQLRQVFFDGYVKEFIKF